VYLRHSQPARRFAFEVKFNQDGRLVPYHPRVVPRFDRDRLWSGVLHDAAVCVLDMDLAASEEPHVRMHAEIGARDRFHSSGPTESGRVHDSLDTAGAGSGDVHLDAANFSMLGARHGR
jgi:hypothetical protein